MQSSFPYFDILIFGVIAIFLILRLRNILGTKTDANNQDINKRIYGTHGFDSLVKKYLN